MNDLLVSDSSSLLRKFMLVFLRGNWHETQKQNKTKYNKRYFFNYRNGYKISEGKEASSWFNSDYLGVDERRMT